jgi:hypothetical protein
MLRRNFSEQALMTTMFNTGDLLSRLEGWYVSQCNGTWEHDFRVKLTTFDNPGWGLTINLSETEWETRSFTPVDIRRSEHNWLQCWVKEKQFHAAGGPLNLREIIEMFLWFVDPFYDPKAEGPQLSSLETKPLG